MRIYGAFAVGRSPNSSYSIMCDGGTNPSYSMRVYKGAYADGNGFVSSSDLRLKKDIEVISGAIEKVKLLRGVEYNWRSDEFPDRSLPLTRQVGLISQEVEVVLPGLVTEDEEGYKGIAYGRVSALLVEAIKEQQMLIEVQQAENQSMKAELQSLKTEIEALKAMIAGSR
ncbi:MAG: tail fiber domain-containing protein [Bacteroidales bacterium]|nr:tail fiber domain-containing protein [Bacteroidales bacterium]